MSTSSDPAHRAVGRDAVIVDPAAVDPAPVDPAPVDPAPVEAMAAEALAAQARGAVLRRAGLRVTRPRLAVLEALESRPHAATDAVLGAVREALPVSVQAVYDVLGTLTERGVVRRFQPAGSVARYELRTGDNHHHVVCRSCGAVADIDCAAGAAPCLDPVELDHRSPGFVLEEAEVTYWGRCADCSATDPAPAGA